MSTGEDITTSIAAQTLKCCAAMILLSVLALQIEHYSAPLLARDQPFDTYNELSWKDEKARLDSFAIELTVSSNSIGHIIVFAGKKACIGEAKARALRARNYVVRVRHVPPERVVWQDAGFREEASTTLVIAPPNFGEVKLPAQLKASEIKINRNCKSGLPIRRL